MQEDLRTTIAFEREILSRVSTRLIPFEFGTAYLNDGYPMRWDSNFLWVERPTSAAALGDEADRVLGGAGLLHREIRVDEDDIGSRIAPGLADRGYGADRLVVMALRREPDTRSEPNLAEEADLSTVRPMLETVIGREPYATSMDTVRALADYREELERLAGARFYCARVGAEIASICELYADGDVAQVEDVNTLQEFRGRGLARAVVQRAVDDAIAGGAKLVFLHALADDWPKELYAKLGFDPIGHMWSFVRPSDPQAKSTG